MKALFVCTGNTCRSPLAAAFFIKLAGAAHSSDSCGVSAFGGSAASYGSRNIAPKFELSLDSHQTKPVSAKLIIWADKVYCMTRSQAEILRDDYPDFKAKITTLSARDIADPFGGDEIDYGLCAKEIEAAVRKIAEGLK